MAKTTLGKLSNPVFTNSMQLLLSKPLPVRTAFRVKTLVDKFNVELKKFSELRKEILDRHALKDENGAVQQDERGQYRFDPASTEDLNKELNDLLAIEVEFEPLKAGELGNIELTAQQLFDLGEVVADA